MAIAQAPSTGAVARSSNLGQPPSVVPADQAGSAQALRALFLKSSLRMSQPLDAQSGLAAGQQYTFKVPGVGIARFVRLFVTATITGTVGTGTLAISPRGPFNLLQRIQYNDPGGAPRINASGWQLYLLKVLKKTQAADPTTSPAYNAGATLQSEVFNYPVANGANVWNFWIDVPFEMGPHDTRGLMNLESSTAQSSILVTINNAIYGTSIDSPIVVTGNATAAITNLQIVPVYYFYSPVYLYDAKGVPSIALPTDDLAVIHEVMSARQSALNAGVDNRITLASGRSYYRVILELVSNGAMVTGSVNGLGAAGATAVKWVYDVSKVTMYEPLQAYLSRIRDDEGRDLPVGVFAFDVSQRPWDASHYGQLDAVLTLDNNINTTAPFYVDSLREGLYLAPQAG